MNGGHNAPATLRSFITRSDHGVGAVPHFYFLTGARQALKKVWSDYGITVQIVHIGTLIHSDAMYFIAPGGAERYQVTPFANERTNGTGSLPAATVARWGKGIAAYAEKAAG
ncbi:MAG: hypothetical protein ACRDYZ_15500 [Acidimicrobiales bacterium]